MNGFLHPTFDGITGQTNRSSLMELHKNLCKNAAYLHSNPGGGNHGLLTIVIGAQYYLVQTVHAFIDPINPVSYPKIMDHAIDQ